MGVADGRRRWRQSVPRSIRRLRRASWRPSTGPSAAAGARSSRHGSSRERLQLRPQKLGADAGPDRTPIAACTAASFNRSYPDEAVGCPSAYFEQPHGFIWIESYSLNGSMPPSMARVCQRCNAPMERGFTTAHGLIGGDRAPEHRAQILFVVPGTPTSSNPLKAFAQGRADGPSDRRYGIAGWRCTGCGLLEFCSDGDPVA